MIAEHFQLLVKAGWQWDGARLVHPRHGAVYDFGPNYVDSTTAKKMTDRLMQDLREARRLNAIGARIEAGKLIVVITMATSWLLTLVALLIGVFPNTATWMAVVLIGALPLLAVANFVVDEKLYVRLMWKKTGKGKPEAAHGDDGPVE